MAEARDRRASSSKSVTTVKVETFELSKKPHPYIPVSTTKILENFTRDPPTELSHSVLQERYREIREHEGTIEELRRWARKRESHVLFKIFLRSLCWKDTKIRMPAEPRLYHAIDHYFPPRMDIKITICDFGIGRAERQEVRLGDIERELRAKPSWATVRWIHAPLGVGLLHSSLEALFFHTGSKVMGRPFTRAGRAGWPYLEVETLDLRSAHSVQDSRDLLRIVKDVEQISDDLDRSIFVGDNNDNLKKDVSWRAKYVGQGLNFCEMAKDDLPWQTSEGSHLNMNGPSEGVRTTDLQNASQSLAMHSFFKNACIARSPFRCFHRNDGFLLTMSPAAGVDYLNANLPHYLHMSREELSRENFASAMAQVWKEFSESGTSTWFRKDVEWFLVYLITEVAATPHNIRQGYSVPSLMDAYDAIVHELKARRYDRWQRNETINLVRSYLACIDELTVLEEIFAKKLDFFQRLRKDCDALELEDSGTARVQPEEQGETHSERIAFAEQIMQQSSAELKRLVADLRDSLNSLFQLRSIEQNELAIMADTQNKAIFVFTAVTIIFLPLSFFTSYFGMNLRGIVNTDKTEKYFWKVCGSVAIALMLLTCLYAFRYRIRHHILAHRTRKAAKKEPPFTHV